eukprot:Tamp_17578.p1 GENE.Tamp_17578~~Tamp_17578.p1  ORF type:complete len:215 (-),score=46.34 Tamp_17578:654-1298(-)
MGCFACCTCFNKSKKRVAAAAKAAENQVAAAAKAAENQAGALAHAAAAKALAAERAVAAGAQHLAEDSAQRLAQGAGDMMEALGEPDANEQYMQHLAMGQSAAGKGAKWSMGSHRLAPQHSAKYTPADGQKNEMSHLDQRLSIKQKELNAMGRELAVLKIQLDEAQERFDVCQNQWQQMKNDCDDLKKRKAHLRVFGRAKEIAENSGGKKRPKG